jgi:membrane fusion protein, multidrug efflux system
MDGWPPVFRFCRVEIVPTDEHETASTVSPKANTTSNATGTPRRRVRRTWAIAAAAVVAVAVLIYWLHSRRFESTDDAQIDADVSDIGARVGGTVTRVGIVENQVVHAGDILAEVDPTDLEVAVAQARASVAQAEAQLAAADPSVPMTETSNAAALTNAASELASASALLTGAGSEVEQARAQLAQATASNHNAQLDRKRGEELFAHGALPRAELDRRIAAADAAAAGMRAAQKALAVARARVTQQRSQLTATRGRLAEVQNNAPRQVETRRASVLSRRADLELARAQLRQAELNLGYARVRTPVAGIVARKAVNVGDRIAPGQSLAAVAQIDRVWVTANFRETQIRHMHPGQTASVHVDALDRGYSGVVESLGGATGSRVSVLPPENASGNYVKIVQRIPVRIRIDGGQPGLERLRPGMSVEPKVRVLP